ncbi:tumor necrosis factor receptor superfamily member 13B [Clupea harengus]|uniref:Tumor necrosis factor receptor superfamily member 13B n=1 Tax=Clupea harengus TaxID=7950 RepID=A0A6P8GIH3_CLUHA|nr:tumor necrosis factor receptor superfamily member 13B [Clupea harengus]
MSRSCREGEFWDGLVRKCMPCEMVCQQAHVPARCTDYCVSSRCRATADHFYDQLLKKCLSCALVCGTHPRECVTQCHAQTPIVSDLLRPAVVAAVPVWSSRGSSVLVFSLLGVCVLLLLACSICLALLLHRRHSATRGQQRAQQQLTHQRKQKGQDVEGQKWHWATETCVHCFPRSEEGTPTPHRLADSQNPPTPHRLAGSQNPTPNGRLLQQDNCCYANGLSHRQQCESMSEKQRNSPLHIICSPAQDSL